MGSILSAIGTWILKMFLGGIFGSQQAHLEDEVDQTHDAAVEHAQSTVEAAQTEVDIIKAQEDMRKKYEGQTAKPNDPFNVEEWNKS